MGTFEVLYGKAERMDLFGFCNEMLRKMALYYGLHRSTGPLFCFFYSKYSSLEQEVVL